jgi:hypothetical protein
MRDEAIPPLLDVALAIVSCCSHAQMVLAGVASLKARGKSFVSARRIEWPVALLPTAMPPCALGRHRGMTGA